MSDKPTTLTAEQLVVEGQPVILEELHEYVAAYKEIAPYFDLPNGWAPFPKLLAGVDTAAEFYRSDRDYYTLRGYKPQLGTVDLRQEYIPSCFIICFFQPKVTRVDDKTLVEMTEKDLGQPIALATISMLPSYQGSLKSHHSYFVHDVKWLGSSAIDTTDIDDLNTALKIYNYRHLTNMIELVHYDFPIAQLTPWVSYVRSIQRHRNTLTDYVNRYRYAGQLTAVDATFALIGHAPRGFFTVLEERCKKFQFVTADHAETYPEWLRLEFYRAFLHVISGVLMYVSPTTIQMWSPEQVDTLYHRYAKLAEYYQYDVYFTVIRDDDAGHNLPLVGNCILSKTESTDYETVITIENYWRYPHVDLANTLRYSGSRGLFEFIMHSLVECAESECPHPKVKVNLDLQDAADLQYSFDPKFFLCSATITGLTFDFTRKMNHVVSTNDNKGNEL